MEHYSAAVQLRMPSHSLLPISAPLFIDTDLDTASVPNDCFIRKFLTGVKTPHFNLIAPGLRVPNDKEEFARLQRLTILPQKEDFAPAVLLFPTSDRRVDLNLEKKYLFLQDGESSAMNEGDSISTGLYSEPLSRDRHDTEEAGFPLLLSFLLRPDLRDEEGARMSDGRLVESGSFTELFQHDLSHPFGGERRSQRLERLFGRWTELVETGVWTVGEHGVEEGVDTFRDADRGDGAWRNYWIEPDWRGLSS
ncbi:unnamed protein product [Penicillium olsonii]|nr:unnamed protein product [Penicillium olsonii]CAG7930047.1 unnamed protein product [Penicillium olsonii]